MPTFTEPMDSPFRVTDPEPVPHSVHPGAWKAVRRGLNWLKESGPRYGFDWTRINIEAFNVGNGADCPLAQASGMTFTNALYLVLKDNDHAVVSFREMSEWAAEHGFASPSREQGGYWFKDLNYAWQLALAAERFAAVRT